MKVIIKEIMSVIYQLQDATGEGGWALRRAGAQIEVGVWNVNGVVPRLFLTAAASLIF